MQKPGRIKFTTPLRSLELLNRKLPLSSSSIFHFKHFSGLLPVFSTRLEPDLSAQTASPDRIQRKTRGNRSGFLSFRSVVPQTNSRITVDRSLSSINGKGKTGGMGEGWAVQREKQSRGSMSARRVGAMAVAGVKGEVGVGEFRPIPGLRERLKNRRLWRPSALLLETSPLTRRPLLREIDWGG